MIVEKNENFQKMHMKIFISFVKIMYRYWRPCTNGKDNIPLAPDNINFYYSERKYPTYIIYHYPVRGLFFLRGQLQQHGFFLPETREWNISRFSSRSFNILGNEKFNQYSTISLQSIELSPNTPHTPSYKRKA